MAAEFKPGKTVGIDLGTTRSSVAHVDSAGRAAIIPNADSELVTPSVVLIDESDVIVVGTQAKNEAIVSGSRVIRESKRDIGRTDATWDIDGVTYTPEMVGSLILTKLKQDAERQLGEPIVNAVITVPAYFDDSQRAATRSAGELAGLNVVGILNEPVAAALAYGLERQRTDGHIVVYDLGGGTFDVSVMRVSAGGVTMIATDGNVELGGKDWDQRIINYVAEQFREAHGVDPLQDVDAFQQLKNDAEAAKETLTNKERAKIIVQYGGHKLVCELTREKFDELTADLLSQTSTTLDAVVEDQAGLTWDDVSRVLLVGGSSKMPQVAAMVREITGKDVQVGDPQPDLCVALGAAYHAQILEVGAARDDSSEMDEAQRAEIMDRLKGLPPQKREQLVSTKVTHVTSHAYGVQAAERGNSGEYEPYNAVLIQKNAPLPASHTDEFYALEEGQSGVDVVVWEGEERDLDFCKKAGNKLFEFPPVARGTPIRVTMHFTEEGLIVVDAQEQAHGTEVHLEIERPQGMTVAERKRAGQLLAKKIVE